MGLLGKSKRDTNRVGEISSAWIDESGAVIRFSTANHNVTGKNRQSRHYRGQCDYFAVFCSELNKAYLIPVDQVGVTQACLRLVPTKNNQEKHIQWAKDYEL